MSDFDPLDPAGQESAKALREAIGREQLAQESEDFRWLMADARGRRFLWRLLESAGVFQANEHYEPVAMSRKEGMRGIGLKYWGQVFAWCPEKLTQLMKEGSKINAQRSRR